MYHRNILAASACLLGLASAAPPAPRPRAYSAPASDGFPNPTVAQLAAIQERADGQLSNQAPPPSLAPSSLTAFQLIAFNENFEVAFFSSLIDNITADVPGYNLNPHQKSEVLTVLKTVKAQEELHAINAEDVLTHFDAFAPPPCTYTFPTTDIKSAITLASTFTSLVLGTLQDASEVLAINGNSGPVRAVASVIGQEGEQNGWYRSLLGFKPSEKPFLTTSTAPFAFSALQSFVVECPFNQTEEIDIPVFPALSVLGSNGGANVSPQDQTLTFSADLTAAPEGWQSHLTDNGKGLFVTYLTGLNNPVSEPVQSISWSGNTATFKAFFPFAENNMDGLSIAALTTSGNFTNFDDVPNATLAAPALILVNDVL